MSKAFFLSLAVIVLVVHCAVAKAVGEDGFSLANAEEVAITSQTVDQDSVESNDTLLSFHAFGKQFDLMLHEQNELNSRLSSTRRDIRLYTGTLQGKEDSWVRMTLVANQYSGAIFDGKELFILDTGRNINDALSGPTDMRDVNTVIYKASELSSDFKCGIHEEHQSSFAYSDLLPKSALNDSPSNAEFSDFEVAAVTNLQQINLRIVVDTEYADSSSLSAEEQVISQMNIVDGIFTAQLDVQFGITAIEVLNNNGNLSSTNASTLLNQFRTFVGNNNPGLSHLFTGRDIDGGTIGICLLYTSPSPRDKRQSRMPSSA